MRILIVDDHPIMIHGVRQLLEAAFDAVEVDAAASLEEALQRIAGQTPELIILDLSLPDASGIEAPARLLRVARGVPLLVLTLNPESAFAARLLQMGVSGYLTKDRAGDELILAVQRLLAGGRYVTASMADHLLGLLSGEAPEQRPRPHELLSAQEYRVMQMIAAGWPPARIALATHLSVKAVGSYRARIFDKTGWKSNAELSQYCLQHRLADPV